MLMMISRRPTPPISETPLNALLRAHAKSAQVMAVYLIGGGAWVATALLALAYQDHFSAALRAVPYGAAAVALLWVVIGGYMARRNHQAVQACSHVYNVGLQRLAHNRNRPSVPSGWAAITNLFHTAPPSTAPAARLYARPLSLFGAYDAPQQHTAAR